jgi:protein-tyrosine phosphatase
MLTTDATLVTDQQRSQCSDSKQHVLFICTGNVYRSRFAEAVFNHHAERREIPWTAFSRGLAVHLTEEDLSTFTVGALASRQIELRHTGASRKQLSETDLSMATHRIALYRSEHFPMMMTQFPAWADRIEYWEVPDLPFRLASDALQEIEGNVIQLLDRVSR